MRIGIVSDTHDDLQTVDRTVDFFERTGVETVIHCGDFIAPFAATPFDAGFEFYAVRGNNDGEWALQSVIAEFGTYLGEAGDVTIDGRSIAIYHGTSETLRNALVDCGEYDVVVHGHTHAHGVERRNGTLRVNPGGIAIPVDGADDRFRVATLETDSLAVEHHVLGNTSTEENTDGVD